MDMELMHEIRNNVMLYNLGKLRKKYKVSNGYLALLRMDAEKREGGYSVASFGSKTDTYASEEEMLQGFKCTFEDLSSEEKKIYNNQVKSCRI